MLDVLGLQHFNVAPPLDEVITHMDTPCMPSIESLSSLSALVRANAPRHDMSTRDTSLTALPYYPLLSSQTYVLADNANLVVRYSGRVDPFAGVSGTPEDDPRNIF